MALFSPVSVADIAWLDGVPFVNGECYFCQGNDFESAQQELIVGNQLLQRWRQLSQQALPSFNLGGVGFGAGLHFLLAWSYWEQTAPANAELHVLVSEQHPLSSADLKRCLDFWPSLSVYAEQLLSIYPILTPGVHSLRFNAGRVRLTLMLGDAVASFQQLLLCGEPTLEQQLRVQSVDAWWINERALLTITPPNRDKLYSTLAQLSTSGTTITTHLVADEALQGLNTAGFAVNHCVGSEMLSGYWYKPPSVCLNQRRTPWQVVVVKRPIQQQRAVVVGAGFAGCYLSYALAQRGWQVTLLDENAELAAGASANRRAVVFPNLSAYQAPSTELMLMAFLQAHRFYQWCLKRWSVGELSGMLQILCEKKSAATQRELISWLQAYPELGRVVSAQQASELAGIKVHTDALYIPRSGWIDSHALCGHLINHQRIQWLNKTSVNELTRLGGHWDVSGFEAEVVILANGYRSNTFQQTVHIPQQPLRGQMTSVKASRQSLSLRIPVCAEAHIVPAVQGVHAIGSTFGLNHADSQCYADDDVVNAEAIDKLPIQLTLGREVVGHWAGIRAVTPDHLPLVGSVAEASGFVNRFAGLASDSKRWIASNGDYQEGLYLFSGFGSRGLTTIPLCGDYLVSLINGDFQTLPRHLTQAISPARFLIRDLCRCTR